MANKHEHEHNPGPVSGPSMEDLKLGIRQLLLERLTLQEEEVEIEGVRHKVNLSWLNMESGEIDQTMAAIGKRLNLSFEMSHKEITDLFRRQERELLLELLTRWVPAAASRLEAIHNNERQALEGLKTSAENALRLSEERLAEAKRPIATEGVKVLEFVKTAESSEAAPQRVVDESEGDGAPEGEPETTAPSADPDKADAPPEAAPAEQPGASPEAAEVMAEVAADAAVAATQEAAQEAA